MAVVEIREVRETAALAALDAALVAADKAGSSRCCCLVRRELIDVMWSMALELPLDMALFTSNAIVTLISTEVVTIITYDATRSRAGFTKTRRSRRPKMYSGGTDSSEESRDCDMGGAEGGMWSAAGVGGSEGGGGGEGE